MKYPIRKCDVHPLEIFIAKIGGKICRVQIGEPHPKGGWNAINLETAKIIRIKSAAKLKLSLEKPYHPKTVLYGAI